VPRWHLPIGTQLLQASCFRNSPVPSEVVVQPLTKKDRPKPSDVLLARASEHVVVECQREQSFLASVTRTFLFDQR
jgi:hypothetical protein